MQVSRDDHYALSHSSGHILATPKSALCGWDLQGHVLPASESALCGWRGAILFFDDGVDCIG